MSEGLTAALEAAAAATWDEQSRKDDVPTPWAEVHPMLQFQIREVLLPAVAAAAGVLRRLADEDCARRVEAWAATTGHVAGDPFMRGALAAADVVRGGR